MFKRALWLVTGAGFGFGSSFWLQRAVKARIERYRPSRVVARAATRATTDLRLALDEGRAEAARREAELRVELGHPRPALGPGTGPGRRAITSGSSRPRS